MMTATKIITILHLVLFCAALGGYYYYFSAPQFGMGRFGASIAGLLFTVFLVGGLSNFWAARIHWLDQQMIRNGLNEEFPKDGERYAAIGTIEPIGEPLLAPFSQTPCIAYEYKIQHWGTEDIHDDYDGEALVPSQIITRQGAIKLLGYPSLVSVPMQRSQEFENANRYIRTVKFEQASLVNAVKLLGSVKSKMEAELKDRSGFHRRDISRSGLKDVSGCYLDEKFVRVGEHVCVLGRYSAMDGGMVQAGDYDLRLLIAGPDAVLEENRSTVKKNIRYGVFFLLAAGIFLAPLWLARNYKG